MKKIAKVVVGITMAAAVAATAGAIAGCGSSKTGEAYGLTHGAGYVGYSKIVVSGDKVKDLVLTEVCLPTEVTAGDTVAAADKVTGTYVKRGKTYTAVYYKSVTVGSTAFTYDETIPEGSQASIGYKMSDGTTLLSWLSTETNCKAYYEAVTTNAVKVTVGGEQKNDIMNNASLSKEVNGYWTLENGTSQWKTNRDATVNYVKTNGVANLTKLKKNADTSIWMDGEISTGATWSDLNPDTSDGYFSYAELIIKANEAAK
ncbi:MAG: hypothetical protein ACI4MB_05375 [Candidatus Coproplasma sp.]